MNASTFTARVIASTGADVAACLSGAVGAMSGGVLGGLVGLLVGVGALAGHRFAECAAVDDFAVMCDRDLDRSQVIGAHRIRSDLRNPLRVRATVGDRCSLRVGKRCRQGVGRAGWIVEIDCNRHVRDSERQGEQADSACENAIRQCHGVLPVVLSRTAQRMQFTSKGRSHCVRIVVKRSQIHLFQTVK